jgi:N-acetylmuramic acid 6-phosphate (MurNAc-6-P) etherase
MVDMQLSNHKLEERGARMIMDELKISFTKAKELLMKYGNVRQAIKAYFEEPVVKKKTKTKSKKQNKKATDAPKVQTEKPKTPKKTSDKKVAKKQTKKD